MYMCNCCSLTKHPKEHGLKDIPRACSLCSLGAFHWLLFLQPTFFSGKECFLGLFLWLFLEHKEHPAFPPSWTIAHHTPVRSPSMSLARPASFTSSPREVMEQQILETNSNLSCEAQEDDAE